MFLISVINYILVRSLNLCTFFTSVLITLSSIGMQKIVLSIRQFAFLRKVYKWFILKLLETSPNIPLNVYTGS